MIVGLHRLGIEKKFHQQMYLTKFSHNLKIATAPLGILFYFVTASQKLGGLTGFWRGGIVVSF